MNYEVKADPLEAAFEHAAPVVAVTRPVLSGGTVQNPAKTAFVDGYLRRGAEVELKSFTGVTVGDGGYPIQQTQQSGTDY